MKPILPISSTKNFILPKLFFSQPPEFIYPFCTENFRAGIVTIFFFVSLMDYGFSLHRNALCACTHTRTHTHTVLHIIPVAF